MATKVNEDTIRELVPVGPCDIWFVVKKNYGGLGLYHAYERKPATFFIDKEVYSKGQIIEIKPEKVHSWSKPTPKRILLDTVIMINFNPAYWPDYIQAVRTRDCEFARIDESARDDQLEIRERHARELLLLHEKHRKEMLPYYEAQNEKKNLIMKQFEAAVAKYLAD